MDHTLHSLPTHEIPSVIEKASIFGGRVAQASSTTNISTMISRIDVDTSGILLIKLCESVEIEKGRPVSIKLNYRNVSFLLCAQDYSLEGHTLIGQLPREAKAIAIRDTERYAFPLDSRVNAVIHRVEKRGGPLAGEIRLIDVSKTGLGFLLTHAEEEGLLQNDHIWVKAIDGVVLEKPIFGRIVYSTERRYKDSIDIKCGVALEAELPFEIFAMLKKKCRLILRA